MRLLSSLLFVCATAALALDVRVESRNGVPQITVDGQPVRPRWFWGAPTSTHHPIEQGSQLLDLRYLCDNDYRGPVTFHLRFQNSPVTLWIEKIIISDTVTGEELLPPFTFAKGMDDFKTRWNYWPFDEQNTVGSLAAEEHAGKTCLKLTLVDPPSGGRWPDFHIYSRATELALVAGRTYRVQLWLSASAPSALVFAGYAPPGKAGHSFSKLLSDGQFQSQIKLAAGAGIDFVSTPVPMPWPKPGEEPDWSGCVTAVERVLRTNPRAKLVPRLGMAPPSWWMDENPDELMAWQDNRQQHRRTQSVSSQKWLSEACRHLAALIEFLDNKYPDNMAGYHPCGQNTGEWFYQDSWSQEYHGYGKAEQDAFRDWIIKRYPNDDALRQAWQQPAITRQAVRAPEPQRRRDAERNGMLLKPGQAQDVIDYNLFLQDAMSDAVLAIAKTIRTASKGKKLSVHFYGYGYEFAAMSRMSASGHYKLRALLDSPDVDILCSPISYTDRQLGGAAHAMSAAESVLLAGKLWLYEDDTSTHLSTGTPPGWKQRAKNQWESRQKLVRNTAQEICRNFACWWMDLRAAGWFNDPTFWQDMKQLEAMEWPLIRNPQPFRPDIASVLDEFSANYTIDGNGVSRPLIYIDRASFPRSGSTFGQYLLDDLLAGKVSSRLLVMLNPWVLDDAQRQALRQAVADRCVLWCHAPGIMDPVKGLDLQASAALSGFQLQPMTTLAPCVVNATAAGRAQGLPESWGSGTKPALLFSVVTAPGDEILATWPDGAAAVVRRGQAFFNAMPALPPELLRYAAACAGITSYTKDDCVLFARDPYFVVHANHEGPVTLHFPEARNVTDLMINDAQATTAAKSFTMDLRLGETKVIKATPAK
ncbi:MAG: beta-galactosidase [Lentisphaeria bacterium]|jgi:beta-galactosidase